MLEYFLFFGAFPAALSFYKPHGLIYAIMWGICTLTVIYMRRHHGWRFTDDWNWSALTPAFWKRILLRFIPIALALLVFTALVVPEHLLSLPLQRPYMWVMVLLFYPQLSVIPQELIFRSYFFKRFGKVFKSQNMLILASSAAFGWMHILLQNPVAVCFSFLGGLLFSHTYATTKSLAAACAEHALYGCYIFTLGLGIFFYHGMAVK